MSEQWKQGTVFLRNKGKDGTGYVSEHACWNTDLFIASQNAAAIKAGGSIEVITEADYKRSKKQ